MRTHDLVLPLFACAALAAQQPSAWSSLPIPGGVDPLGVMALGKLISYADGGEVHVFSSATRRWHTLATSGSIVRNANDWVLIQDTNGYTAFSSVRGTFESIAVSPSAVIVNPSTQRNDSIILLRDGNQLHAFSGLEGSWVTLAISPAALIAVERNVAVVADGPILHGFSAYRPTWVRWVTLNPATQVYAGGTVGLAYSANAVHGFSAQRGTWRNAAALGPGSFAAGDDLAVWSDGTRALGFSGLRGAFDTVTTGAPSALQAEQALGIAASGTQLFFFSAPRARWTALLTLGAPVVRTSAATALVQDQSGVHGYSALLGTVASLPVVPSVVEIGWTVGAVREPLGNQHLFSAFTGQWHPGPPGSQLAFPLVAFQAVLLPDAAGLGAFSARSGRYVPLGATGTPYVDASSGVVAVAGAQALHVFDTRREVWLSAPWSGGGTPTVHVWRTSLVAFDGQRAYGYGAQSGRLEGFDLPGPVVDFRASSESVSVVTANELVGFSTTPDLSTLWQFPEFRRIFAPGSALELALYAPQGAVGGIVLGFPLATAIPLPIGPFLLDPAALLPVWTGVLPAEQRAVVRFGVPDAPAVSGVDLAFQGAVLAPSGQAWTTDMCALHVP